MDALSFGEAKKVKRAVGNLNNLQTSSKTNVVAAINELYQNLGGNTSLLIKEYDISNVAEGELREFWLDFIDSGFIRGIKCTGNEFTGNFTLKIFTKPPDEGGAYVYFSGLVNNVLWDIMDIPFSDESGERKVYVELENSGIETSFRLQIYMTKG